VDLLDEIFERQLELQRSAFGVDPSALSLEKRVEYIDWNLTALTQEVAEARNEIAWKNWATDYRQWLNDPALLHELADCLHFYVNVCLAIGITPDELAEAYHSKREVNVRRQAEGYTHDTMKCGTCGRALDEPS
jgi:dimeric dUTPase (all-alpha-NTP-PPase superfamily)